MNKIFSKINEVTLSKRETKIKIKGKIEIECEKEGIDFSELFGEDVKITIKGINSEGENMTFLIGGN